MIDPFSNFFSNVTTLPNWQALRVKLKEGE
jgi:hypothetical protein